MSHALERAGAGTGTGLVSYGNGDADRALSRHARESDGIRRDLGSTQGCYEYSLVARQPTVSTESWCLLGCPTEWPCKTADLITSLKHLFFLLSAATKYTTISAALRSKFQHTALSFRASFSSHPLALDS